MPPVSFNIDAFAHLNIITILFGDYAVQRPSRPSETAKKINNNCGLHFSEREREKGERGGVYGRPYTHGANRLGLQTNCFGHMPAKFLSKCKHTFYPFKSIISILIFHDVFFLFLRDHDVFFLLIFF